MTNNENILFNNRFGTVTSKRVILNYKSGAEELPVSQITSISLRHQRNYFFAFGGFAVAIAGIALIVDSKDMLGSTEILLILLFVLIAALAGLANWLGHHNIVISAGGNDRKPLKVEMAKTTEGREFVVAIKRAVIK